MGGHRLLGGCWRRDLFSADRTVQRETGTQPGYGIQSAPAASPAAGKSLLAPDLETRYYARAALGPLLPPQLDQWSVGGPAVRPTAPIVPVRWRHPDSARAGERLARDFRRRRRGMASVVGTGRVRWQRCRAAGPNALASASAASIEIGGRGSLALAILLPFTFAALAPALRRHERSLWGVFQVFRAEVECRKWLPERFQERINRVTRRIAQGEFHCDPGSSPIDSVFQLSGVCF